MPTSEPYELLDFGRGRKLERFGDICLDRPAPAADAETPARPELWSNASARFERLKGQAGQWRSDPSMPPEWVIQVEDFRILLRPTPFGHVGLFPEQVSNWRWIKKRIARRRGPVTVLNLFAYTGGSTLAAAAAGASVVHVDAAQNIVQWARQNAEASGLNTAPIRWITEDVRRFVTRELRRGRRYDAIILDPPSYGHGPNGETWKLSSHLMPLLEDCKQLLSDDPAFVLLTCHSPSYGPAELGASLQQTIFGRCTSQVEAHSLTLKTADERRMAAGVYARG